MLKHKKWLSLHVALLMTTLTFAQSTNPDHGIALSAYYGSEFVVGGYVQVRELEIEGDKMYLQELGMNHYPVLQLQIEKKFRKQNCVLFSYEQYFINGMASFDSTIQYNGTIIEGMNGVDVSSTRYFRLSGYYKGNLYVGNEVQFQLLAGLVYDHITFCVEGDVLPESPRDEGCEQFGRQALPYPVLGISTSYSIKDVNLLQLEVTGTYIPLFESFFVEGSNMKLQYSTFLADLKYTRKMASLRFSLGVKFRSMHLFQESTEDTNDLIMEVFSPYLGIGYVF